MQAPAVLLTLLVASVAMAAQPPELVEMAKRIVPRVRIANDAEFFAAWNLDFPGMEAVKARVAAGEFAGASVWSRLTACVPLNGSWLDGYNYFLRSEHFTPDAHAIMLSGASTSIPPSRTTSCWWTG